MKAVAYLRVSTDKQADNGLSLEVQRAKVEAYAALYDHELVAVEVDSGESAKSLARPALQRALARLDAEEAAALLVVKLDRLTRSVRDLGTLLDEYFRDRFALMAVGEQVDTSTAAGRLVLNVLMSVAEWERETIGERTSAALQHKRDRFEYTGGPVPFGWTVSADGIQLEPELDEQAIIEAAGELRAAGFSLRKIATALEARGMKTRKGGPFRPQQVKGLLEARTA